MAKAKKYDYRIQYVDNTYQMVNWTKADFSLVANSMVDNQSAVYVDECVFRISDVRAIVFLPPEPELTTEEKNQQEQNLTDWGFVDPDTAVYLKEVMGIDLSKGGN
jgi:hypothetical protein